MTRRVPPRGPADPLAATELLLVDANNVVHALARVAGAPPAVALVGHLRSLIPARIAIELVFDGPPERGLSRTRIASGLSVRYSGRQTADEVIVARVTAEANSGGPVATAAILVITDDRGLRELVGARGARTAGTSWLASRLSGARSIGSLGTSPAPNPAVSGRGAAGRSPAGASPDDADEDDGRPVWKPGRGATVKRGNPRRNPRARRPPSNG